MYSVKVFFYSVPESSSEMQNANSRYGIQLSEGGKVRQAHLRTTGAPVTAFQRNRGAAIYISGKREITSRVLAKWGDHRSHPEAKGAPLTVPSYEAEASRVSLAEGLNVSRF